MLLLLTITDAGTPTEGVDSFSVWWCCCSYQEFIYHFGIRRGGRKENGGKGE